MNKRKTLNCISDNMSSLCLTLFQCCTLPSAVQFDWRGPHTALILQYWRLRFDKIVIIKSIYICLKRNVLPVGSTKVTKLKSLKAETDLGKSDPKLNQNQKGSKTIFWNLTFFVSLKDTSIKTFVKPALENEILSNTLSCFWFKP